MDSQARKQRRRSHETTDGADTHDQLGNTGRKIDFERRFRPFRRPVCRNVNVISFWRQRRRDRRGPAQGRPLALRGTIEFAVWKLVRVFFPIQALNADLILAALNPVQHA